MSGWIRLHRKIRENFLWRERRRFSKAEAWIDLLIEAAYEDHEQLWRGLVVPVKRGQYLTTQGDLAARWQWNRETVRVFLRFLEGSRMAAIRTSKESETGFTLISIVNYELYQGNGPRLTTSLPPSVPPSEPASTQHPAAIRPPLQKKEKKGKKPL